jgi:hypothetical protein
MHWLSLFFYVEAEFEPLEENNKKRLTSIEIKFVRITAGTHFDHKRNEEILEEMEV